MKTALLGCAFAFISAITAQAQSDQAAAKPATTSAPEAVNDHKPVNSGPRMEITKTFYLSNITQQNDLNDIQTAIRNVLPRARLYAVPTQEAIVISSTAQELAEAQQVIEDLDRIKKIYRLTYTITDTDQGKRIGIQHYSVIIASGSKTNLKQGSKVPMLTGTTAAGSNPEVQYIEVGLEIEANLDSYLDGVRLRSKISQSSLVDEKPGDALHGDPIVRQTVLEGTSTLVQGKTQTIGSLDIPGSTRHQEIEVLSELVR